MNNKSDLTNFAATILNSFGIDKAETMKEADKEVLNKITETGKREKAFLFHTDAVPAYIVKKYPEIFTKVRENTKVEAEFNSVMPSITPVCFGAMFSGAYPENNGIPKYLKPILSKELVQPSLKVTTMVDLLTENGLKTALVTCSNGCIASMLYKRGADMFIIDGDDDEKMYNKALELLVSDNYDVIMLYQLSFDYKMHKMGPENEESLNVLKEITDRFGVISEKVKEIWKDKKYITVFNTDHGSHLNPPDDKNKGGHGLDIPEDMELIWFFGAN